MLQRMIEILERPPIYAKTETAFWNDAHISKQMLKAHLNPEFEGASRKLAFIEKSVAWIKDIAPPTEYPLLLDVGCGPGIYAERFSNAGYQTTGVDFSKRSIDYAKNAALKKGIDVTYCYQDYLSLQLSEVYDFATMIYCDYGALSPSDRKILMGNIDRRLRRGGRFLLDVFSMAKYNEFQETQTWQIHSDGGFWREDEYLEFNRRYKYTGNVTLEQTAIISDKEARAYYLWNTCFTKETLMEECKEAGFRICEVFGDVAGEVYNEDSFTIAILLEK